MNAVIKAENLGKKYIISHQKLRGRQSLRDTMTHTAKSAWQRIRHPLSPNRESTDLEELWALKDINFEVQQGERVGIIGRNGAGKSTLLKVLSRITEPTTGKVRIKGRVSSLLEVGTGFHPELTGRENVFLNGAILGMTRQEIKQKFDKIIAFAEIEKFLDTPVKRYSSGMYVRLAFAVAAHLEPEILIVDEVLAVGDAAFQKKCLGKMENLAEEGRTVLFVSHDLQSIIKLTSRSLLLNDGSLAMYDDTYHVVQHYRDLSCDANISIEYNDPYKDLGVTRAKVTTSESNQIHHFGKPLTFQFEIKTAKKIKSIDFAFQIFDENFRPILNPRIVDIHKRWSSAERVKLSCILANPRIYMGTYALRVYLGDRSTNIHYETLDQICSFKVVMDSIQKEVDWLPRTCAYLEDVEWVLDK